MRALREVAVHREPDDGLLVHRDAADQAAAAVPVGDPRPGDLWFFGRPDELVSHVLLGAGRLS